MGKNYLQQMQQLWARLTSRQRLVVVGGTMLTLVAFAAMVRIFGSPEYKPLMVGLEAEDVQAISAQLSAKKIPFQLTPDGKGINVAVDQLDAARMEIASEGSPHSGRMGFELFDKTSWGQTEFDEKVNYQRALEGELERTIQTLGGIKRARVHLVLPTPSIFLDRERGAKASVALRMKHGTLSPEQLGSIARLVSGAVDGLSARDVVIIDADSNETLGSHSGTMEGRELEADLSKRLLATLGPAVGADNLRASVNVEYDQSSSEENQDKFDPAVSAVLTSQKTKEQVGAGAAEGGVAGTAANLPANTPGAAVPAQDGSLNGDGPQLSTSENATFGVNKTVRHTQTPAGRIHRITAAILINDLQERHEVKGKWISTPRKRTTAQLDQLTALARGVLGVDSQRGDVVTVQNMTFDDLGATEAAPSWVDRVRSGLTDYSTPVRYAAMLLLFVLVWALMFRPVQKQVLASMKEPGAGNPGTPLLQTVANTNELSAGSAIGMADNDLESATMKRELNELIQTEPVSMTRTLQAWLREDNA